jgi:hypothetical protein
VRGASPILKHDEYVERLYEQLKDNYERVYRGLPLYSRRGRLVAEIDLLAVNPGMVDIFEVKCSFRPTKARKQLEKIRRLVSGYEDAAVQTWFYCGEAATLVKV